MKIGIICCTNILHMTLISNYLDLIDQSKHQVDLIYIDKYNISEDLNVANKYKYSININKDDNSLNKLRKYYGFNNFVNETLKRNNYDLFIIWNSLTMQLLGMDFARKYKNKYILNIRDYLKEKNKILYIRMKFFIKNSIFTTISSEGFRKFLPKSNKILMMHSLNKEILRNYENTNHFSEYLNISFLGNVRFYEENKKIINLFQHDQRFQLRYYGTGSDPLEKYCEENNISNVKFSGPFSPNETNKILAETHIINNYYGNRDIALTTALSIRLYYAIFLKKPIIVTPDTYTAEVAEKIGIGFPLIINNFTPDSLYNWYINLDSHVIDNERELYLEKIEKDNLYFKNKFITVLENDI